MTISLSRRRTHHPLYFIVRKVVAGMIFCDGRGSSECVSLLHDSHFPTSRTRGDTEVARGRDVALCTVEAAFQTRPHATLRAMRTRGVGFLGYILYALRAKCRCCVCKNVGCVVLHGVTRAPPCGSHMVLPPRKCVSHPTYQGMGPVHQFFAGSQRAKASGGVMRATWRDTYSLVIAQ